MPMLKAHTLMYHDVVLPGRGPSGFDGAGPDQYKLHWERFLEHLNRIADAVREPPAVVDALPPASAHSTLWVLTFDDGGASAVAVAEELRLRGWRGYFFVTAGLVGTPRFLDADALHELDAMGHVVGAHSMTHPHAFGALPAAEVLREWSESVDVLSQIVGKPVTTASVPGGYYRSYVAVAAARAGIQTLFTSEPVRRVRLVDGCSVVGRYAIRRDTSGGEAARAAAGDPRVWLRQYVAWNSRKPAKMLGGERYDKLRHALLRRRSRRRGRRR